MPTTVSEAFAAAGLVPEGVVKWKQTPKVSGPGVYIISSTKSVQTGATLPNAPLSSSQFNHWLNVCPDLTLHGVRPTAQQLQDQIQRFWIPDETIIYIGLASSLSGRLAGYYNTLIGASNPHSGGYFLKLLSNLNELWVHYAQCSDPESAEKKMLGRFCESVSVESKQLLLDSGHPFPFANLEWPRGTRKAHGLRGVREPKRSEPLGRKSIMPKTGSSVRLPSTKAIAIHQTQQVTAKDLEQLRIRIPSRTKGLFPQQRTKVDVLLRGVPLRISWDPRMGPDKERSGVLRPGPVLRERVQEKERLKVSIAEQGMIALD